MPRCLPMLTSFFDRFLVDYGTLLAPPESQKSSPRCSGSTIFQKIVIRSYVRFWFHLGANLRPFSLPKWMNILSKIDFKRHRFFDRFWHRFLIDFRSILGANLGPNWRQEGPKNGPICGLRLRGTLLFLNPPSKSDFDHETRRFWVRTASMLGRCLVDLGWIFGDLFVVNK